MIKPVEGLTQAAAGIPVCIDADTHKFRQAQYSGLNYAAGKIRFACFAHGTLLFEFFSFCCKGPPSAYAADYRITDSVLHPDINHTDLSFRRTMRVPACLLDLFLLAIDTRSRWWYVNLKRSSPTSRQGLRQMCGLEILC